MAFATGLPRLVINFAAESGYLGVFVLMLLEAAALPIPSEIVLPFAGYLVYQGRVEFWPVIFYSTAAALIGSFIDYYIGLKLGRQLITNPSKLPFVNAEHLRTVENWFHKHGSIAVVGLRLVPAARVLISFPAGAYRMGRLRFAILTLTGCLPWNIALVYFGLVFGESWKTVLEAFNYINVVAYGAIVMFVVWLFWHVAQTRRAKRRR